MTDHISLEPGWVPEACTLPTAERPLRLAEFDTLFSATAHAPERLTPQHLRVTLRASTDRASTDRASTDRASTDLASAGLAGSVRDLAERETHCCSFFTFGVAEQSDGMVRLDIEVPSTHVDVLDALEARATTAVATTVGATTVGATTVGATTVGATTVVATTVVATSVVAAAVRAER